MEPSHGTSLQVPVGLPNGDTIKPMLRRVGTIAQRTFGSRRTGGLIAVSLVTLVILLALWRLLFFDAAIQHDVRTQLYPWTLFISDTLNDGQLPLWNPYAFLGYPIHVDMQARAWFPTVWLLSLTIGYSFKVLQLEVVGTFVFAGIAAFWCGRVFGLSRRAAFVTAVSFALSGAFVGNAQHLPWLVSLCLLPVNLALWRRAQSSGALLDHALLGASIGLVFLGGYPGFFIVSSTMIGCMTIAFNLRDKTGIAALAGRLSTIAGTAAASSAVLLLPVLAIRDEITRGHLSLETVYNSSVNPLLLLQTLIPSLGVGTRDYFALSLPNANLYFGITTLCLMWLAVIALPKRTDGLDRLLIWVGVLSLLLCFGRFGFLRGMAYQFVPGFDQFRFPALFRGYFIFSACLLSGFAFDEIFLKGTAERLSTLRRTVTVVAVIVLVVVLAVFVASLFLEGTPASSNQGELDHPIYHQILFYGPQQVLFLLLFAVILTRTSDGRMTRKTASLLVAGLIALDLATAVNTNFFTVGSIHPNFERIESIENKRPLSMAPVDERIRQTYTKKRGSQANDNMTLRRLQTGGYNPFQLRSTSEFLAVDGHRRVVKKGLAFLTDRVVASSEEGLTSVIDRERKMPTVTLDADPGIDLEPARSVPGHARLTSFRLNRVVFDVTAKRPAVLVMNQAAFPGWSVRVDGEPRPMLVADGALRAVAVPTGRHVVEFRYRPPLLATGAAVSAAFWIGLTLATALRFRRRLVSRSAADYSM